MTRPRKLIKEILAYQDELRRKNPYVAKRARQEGKGKVANLEILMPNQEKEKDTIQLEYKNGRARMVDDEAKPVHTITMRYNTFLSLLSGEISFREAWSRPVERGGLKFSGRNWSYHASVWARHFSKLREQLPI